MNIRIYLLLLVSIFIAGLLFSIVDKENTKGTSLTDPMYMAAIILGVICLIFGLYLMYVLYYHERWDVRGCASRTYDTCYVSSGCQWKNNRCKRNFSGGYANFYIFVACASFLIAYGNHLLEKGDSVEFSVAMISVGSILIVLSLVDLFTSKKGDYARIR